MLYSYYTQITKYQLNIVKKFCTARLIEFKWSAVEFLKVRDIISPMATEKITKVFQEKGMCFD